MTQNHESNFNVQSNVSQGLLQTQTLQSENSNDEDTRILKVGKKVSIQVESL